MTREEFFTNTNTQPKVKTFVRWLEKNAQKHSLRLLWEKPIKGGPQLKYKHHSLPKSFNFGQIKPDGSLAETARLSERFGKKPLPSPEICIDYLREVESLIGKEAKVINSKGREQLYHIPTRRKGVVPLNPLIRRKKEWLAIIDQTIRRINGEEVVGISKPPGPKPARPPSRRIPTPEDLQELDELDESRTTTSRLEQSILRKWVLKGQQQSKCAICGDIYPAALLVAAHIKKRKECDDSEKRNPNNVVAMCKFGCDDLFERGYITVRNGCIADNPALPSTGVVLRRINELKGRRCEFWNGRTEKFFKWHDEQARRNASSTTTEE
jgi:hypothetical protein